MPPTYTVFVHLNATPAWLALTRQARRDFVETELQPVVAKYGEVRIRFFDAEAFTGRCSDIATFETDDLRNYAHMMDALRDTKLFGVPYFEVVDIFPTIEEGFADYDRETGEV